MEDIIQLLPDNVANQIAAGEVVQRPASAVKELLENSIDSGATEISLVIKDAGKTLMQVIDNGWGMSPTDARMSFERHATSKISRAEDLFNLHTKGFRGEALASIAAIAQVELRTRPESYDLGSCIKIEGSKIKSQDPCTTPKGTSISIKNLFFNIPARRNFLKSDKVETKNIMDEFLHVALAHPEIKFTVTNNNTTMYSLPKSNLKKRVDSLFGLKSKDKFFPIEEDTDIVTVQGFVAKPEFVKKRRGEQFFFVNNRFIRSSYLNHAVNAAFEGLLPSDSFPSYFIYLDIDPRSIDINIHPTKTEIKFDDESSIYSILRSTIKHSLGQFNLMPSLDFTMDASLDDEMMKPSSNISQPVVDLDPNYNPFEVGSGGSDFPTKSNSGGGTYNSSSNNYKKKDTSGWDALYSGLENLSPEDSFITSVSNNINGDNVWERETEQQTLNDNEEFSTGNKGETYFQLHRKYILCHVKSGALLIDQNRAHERILYDEIYKGFESSEFTSQQLLFPLEIGMSESDWAILQQAMTSIESIGFVFQGYSNGEAIITGIPSELTETQSNDMVEKLLDSLNNSEENLVENMLNMLSTSYAKSKAMKYGKVLTQEEMSNIFHQLFAGDNPNYTPTGKVISNIISLEDIEGSFA
ncbi:MAG: DNA mismatch repair endonuclease MutL [Ichthyobacteriaceae bacterium]|nr:DNA mismatch repair endonuclease MutL [Ichthyobacteriaceae bacterium]